MGVYTFFTCPVAVVASCPIESSNQIVLLNKHTLHLEERGIFGEKDCFK